MTDLSNLPAASWGEVENLLRQFVENKSEIKAEVIGEILLDRALRILREGSRTDLLDESIGLGGFLRGAQGNVLKDSDPILYGNWQGLAELFSIAGRRSDRLSVDAILRSHASYGRPLLECLVREQKPIRRSELRAHLGIGESQLSHLLRDLQEADLIVRYRPNGRKEVVVELGSAGRELAEASILPPWVEFAAEQLASIKAGEVTINDIDTLRKELGAKGLPSPAAGRLAEAIAALVPAARNAGTAGFIQAYSPSNARWAFAITSLETKRPVSWFGEAA